MIQALSVMTFIAYIVATPCRHDKFRVRLLWFVGAVLSVVSIHAVQQMNSFLGLTLVCICSLPLLLAVSNDTTRCR